MDAVNIQTKFGLGEIVTTHQRRKGNQIIHDQIGEAITIQVSLMAAKTIYFVRVGGQILPFGEDELIRFLIMPHYKLSELSAPLRSRVEGLLPSAPKRRKARQGESPLVASLLRQIASAGLPAPVQEHRFHPIRKWRFDLAWPERMIAVEVDGGVWSGGRHTRGAGFVADCEKTNEATAMGWRVFRFPTPRVSDGTAIAMLRRVMA